MEIVAQNAYLAFLQVITDLLQERKMYGISLQFENSPYSIRDVDLANAFDQAFGGKVKSKGGKLLPWRLWLLNSGFPILLYNENNQDLLATVEDDRVSQQKFMSKQSYHNFFGRLCRKQPQHNNKTFMHYLLERWSNKDQRSQPNFFFDVEPVEWIWHELMEHPKQIKTGRSGATCATNMWFRWNTKLQQPIIGWMIKHCIFTHLYQDIYSPQLIANAINRELGMEWKWSVHLYFISIFLDDAKRAKQILYLLGGQDGTNRGEQETSGRAVDDICSVYNKRC